MVKYISIHICNYIYMKMYAIYDSEGTIGKRKSRYRLIFVLCVRRCVIPCSTDKPCRPLNEQSNTSMYIYFLIYIYIYMCVFIYIYMCIYIYMFKHIFNILVQFMCNKPDFGKKYNTSYFIFIDLIKPSQFY